VSGLQILDQGGGHILIDGDLTFASLDKNAGQPLAFLQAGQPITIDLSRVANADSAGLALLIEWAKYAHRHQTLLSFAQIPQQLLNLAKLSGLEDTLLFHPSA
jgi:phospholipid transport system transporter-binding protein